MLVVIFSHIKKQEKKYLTELLNKKEWFEYEQFPAFLPQSRAHINKELSGKNKLLKRKIVQLQKAWRAIESDYFEIVKKFDHKKLLKKYICHVSRFGPEGKYCQPNLIFVRLRTKRDERRALETIGHELLHLLYADLFDLKKLNYAEREGMVDALILETGLVKLFPRYERQSIGKINYVLLKLILRD